jgi:hypothetical protein
MGSYCRFSAIAQSFLGDIGAIPDGPLVILYRRLPNEMHITGLSLGRVDGFDAGISIGADMLANSGKRSHQSVMHFTDDVHKLRYGPVPPDL